MIGMKVLILLLPIYGHPIARQNVFNCIRTTRRCSHNICIRYFDEFKLNFVFKLGLSMGTILPYLIEVL